MVTLTAKTDRNGSCMECGKDGTRFVDSDGNAFCRTLCAREWHGVDFTLTGVVNGKADA